MKELIFFVSMCLFIAGLIGIYIYNECNKISVCEKPTDLIKPLVNLSDWEREIPTILKAAERNGIKYGTDLWYILLAIRKAENGGESRQFGIMNTNAYNLDLQAGWCAATIVKNRERWIDAGRPDEFIDFLADRYCPKECDSVGNSNWKKNVKYWFKLFKEDY